MKAFRGRWASWSGRLPYWYACGLLTLGCGLLAFRPIVSLDTDLWFHLAGGRSLFEARSVPSLALFSFIEPVRPYVDYYWLFQGLVYAVYRSAGCYGLLALRTGIYAATMGLAFLWLFGRGAEGRGAATYRAFLFALFAMVVTTRAGGVRPHTLEYLCAMSFVFICEVRPGGAALLPAIAALWGNCHGISYPLELWIAGSYVAEYFVGRARGRGYDSGRAQAVLGPLALSMAFIFVTPNGWKLIDVPFGSTAYVSQTILEMLPFKAQDFYSFSIIGGSTTYQSLPALLIAVSVLSFLIGVFERRLRAAHVLLWLGGLVLLSKGNRFLFDSMLLSLPLLAAHPLWKERAASVPGLHPLAAAAAAAVLALLPIRFLWVTVPEAGGYPQSDYGLPVGVARFLSRESASGKLLAEPVASGFLEWEVPRCRIFMDMRIPQIFTEDELYTALHDFSDPKELDLALRRQEPDFVLLPFGRDELPRELVASGFVPVFFDEVSLLYASRRLQPAIASRWALESLDPAAAAKDTEAWQAAVSDPLSALSESRRMIAVDPDRPFVRELASRLESRLGRTGAAIADAELAFRAAPKEPRTALVFGDTLIAAGRPGSALKCYEIALGELPEDLRGLAWRGMGRSEAALGRWPKAYRDLKKSVTVWKSVSSRDFNDFLLVSERSGHPEEAKSLREFAAAHGYDLSNQASWR